MEVICVTTCFIDRYYKAGEKYEYNGPESPHMKPLAAAKPEQEKLTEKKTAK